MPGPTDIKRGTVISEKDDLWVVLSYTRSSSGRGGGFVRVRMKSLSTGKVIENTYKSGETLKFADVMNKKMQYIFQEGSQYNFMDGMTFEQVSIDEAIVGDCAKYLKEGIDATVVMHESNPIAVDIPIKIEYVVAQTEPASKGDTVSGNVQKDAIMENGLKVRVPIFINQGDTIKVNTEEGVYLERVNK
ncbi:elongation factor P [Patescibacteria group bacterium]|nr:elongation factor P [Patescibacteria group bacterium]MBU4453111.1 elongation factor P [Patescibacteria group bacterium]MCG2687289.1 elongation factor P [Candidatus Parcubacteria bacterium]